LRREAELRHRKFRLSGNRAAGSYPEPETWPFDPKIAGRLCDFPAASTRSEKWPICNNTVSQGREPVMVHSNRYPFGVYSGLRNLAQSLQSFLPVTRHSALGATPPNSKCQLMGACPPSTSKADIDRQLLWIATSESTIREIIGSQDYWSIAVRLPIGELTRCSLFNYFAWRRSRVGSSLDERYRGAAFGVCPQTLQHDAPLQVAAAPTSRATAPR